MGIPLKTTLCSHHSAYFTYHKLHWGCPRGYFEEGWYVLAPRGSDTKRATLQICLIQFIRFLLLHPANVEFPKILYCTTSHYTLHSPFIFTLNSTQCILHKTINFTLPTAVSTLFFIAASLFLPHRWFTDAATALFIMLHCTALHCTALHCPALQFTALNWTVLYCTKLNCSVLHRTSPHHTALYWTELLTTLHFTGLYLTASAVDNFYIAAALYKIPTA